MEKNSPRQEVTGTSFKDTSARWWRQIGFWGLTVNMILGFPTILGALWFAPNTNWDPLITIYPTILAAWCTAAGIRQWGKNRGSEPEYPVAPREVVDTGPLD